MAKHCAHSGHILSVSHENGTDAARQHTGESREGGAATKKGATDALSNEITKQKKKKMGTQNEDSFDKSLPDRDKELIKAKQAQAKAAESEYNASQGPSEIEGVLLDVSWNR